MLAVLHTISAKADSLCDTVLYTRSLSLTVAQTGREVFILCLYIVNNLHLHVFARRDYHHRTIRLKERLGNVGDTLGRVTFYQRIIEI